MKRYLCFKVAFLVPPESDGSLEDVMFRWLEAYRNRQSAGEKKLVKRSRFEKWLNARSFDGMIKRIRKGTSEKGEFVYNTRWIRESAEDRNFRC